MAPKRLRRRNDLLTTKKISTKKKWYWRRRPFRDITMFVLNPAGNQHKKYVLEYFFQLSHQEPFVLQGIYVKVVLRKASRFKLIAIGIQLKKRSMLTRIHLTRVTAPSPAPIPQLQTTILCGLLVAFSWEKRCFHEMSFMLMVGLAKVHKCPWYMVHSLNAAAAPIRSNYNFQKQTEPLGTELSCWIMDYPSISTINQKRN